MIDKMNIKNLKEYINTVNNKVNNYKLLCEVLEITIKTGKSKILQMKELDRHFKFHKEGQQIIFDEVYKIINEKIDSTRNTLGNNRKEFPNFLVDLENEKKIGIYKIILDDNIYIGSTVAGFRIRYLAHKSNSNILSTKQMLDDGATFEILEICNGKTEPQIRYKENKYIEEYKKDSNWKIVNTKEAWSYKPKQKYKTIRLKKQDYKNALILLKEQGMIS